MIEHWPIIGFIFLTVLHNSYSDTCEICVCLNTDTAWIIDCRGKRLESSTTLHFDLLMFDEYRNVSTLILSENGIFSFPLDAFRNLKHLKTLDLSQNLIEEVHADTFNDLITLTELDLSSNDLKILDSTVFNKISTVSKLNLSHNHLDNLDQTIGSTLTKLTHLDVSDNNLSILANGLLKPLMQLQYLDISFNKIISLGTDNLMHLNKLTTLYLNNNFLVSISSQELPGSLVYLNAGYNRIVTMPYNLSQIKTLNVEYNLISEIDRDKIKFYQVESLNVSGNALTDFPNVKFEKLSTLDVSHNRMSIISESLKTENLPALKTLVISGNPIRELKFTMDLRLQWLVAQALDLLEAINADAFIKLKGTTLEECINLTISRSNQLNFIHEKALNNVNVCFLDLSNNKFTHISPKLIKSDNGLRAKYGIDLQGNPFHCNCTSQWMLNELVPELYSINPKLLNNLRCATPPELADKRMVHWYNWQEQVLCNDEPILISKITAGTVDIFNKNTGTIRLESSTGMQVVLVSAGVVLLILVIIGIVLAQRIAVKRSRKNRRF